MMSTRAVLIEWVARVANAVDCAALWGERAKLAVYMPQDDGVLYDLSSPKVLYRSHVAKTCGTCKSLPDRAALAGVEQALTGDVSHLIKLGAMVDAIGQVVLKYLLQSVTGDSIAECRAASTAIHQVMQYGAKSADELCVQIDAMKTAVDAFDAHIAMIELSNQ